MRAGRLIVPKMPSRPAVLLSVQRALLGNVPASLRAVACGWTERAITLRSIFDGRVSAELADAMRAVGSEVIADFPAPTTIDEQILRIDWPAGLEDRALQAWAYRRKEARS